MPPEMTRELPRLLLYLSFMFLGTGVLFFLVNQIPISKKNPEAELWDPTRPLRIGSPYLIGVGVVLLALSGTIYLLAAG
jgi:hypothetical protein